MVRKLLFGIVMLLVSVSQAVAGDWTFHYGPDMGVGSGESYARVTSGSNEVLVYIYDATQNAIGVNITLDTFENGGKVLKSLQAGEPLKLDILRQNDRYERVIDPSQYAWKVIPERKNVLIVFLLTGDDLAAMTQGRAAFIWTGTLQSRFGLVGADTAIRRLVAILYDN